MKRNLAAGAILAVAALNAAIGGVAFAAPRGSITVEPEVVTVGDPVPFEWSYRRALHRGEFLVADLSCQSEAVGVGLAGSVLASYEPNVFGTGVTPSYDGSSALDCTVTLLLRDSFSPRTQTIAEDAFLLSP